MSELLNSKIAAIMGWSIDRDKYGIVSHEYHILEFWDEQPEYNKFMIAKLLQARMREDGWHIHLYFVLGQPVQAEAFHSILRRKELSQDQEEEPAALHALFCKVFSIEGEG